ncbi:MAG: glycosyltransferase family 2 protein [Candidatus Hydrogenedens sp.]|nr:glycosyltransferase family 2 protein [Candidatus Hydrogenedens sp.]
MSNRPEHFKLSIVAPVYNEGAYLEHFVSEIISTLEKLNLKEFSEIILINDGSTDDTGKIADSLAEQYQDIIGVIHLARNFGQPSAITAGLHYVRGDCVIIMDSDGQDDPKCFSDFIKLWQEGYDVVFAKRTNRKETILFRFFAWLFYRLLSISAQVNLPLDAGNFGLLDKKVVDAIKTCPERNRYLPGLRSWVGFKQTGIDVERRARYDKKNRVGLRGLWTLAMNAFFSFSYVPLFFFRLAGFCSLLLCFIIIIFALYHKLITGLAVTAWASQLISVSFFGGINLLGIGLLGEYIARIYDEVKQRPLFICARTTGLKNKITDDFNTTKY